MIILTVFKLEIKNYYLLFFYHTKKVIRIFIFSVDIIYFLSTYFVEVFVNFWYIIFAC